MSHVDISRLKPVRGFLGDSGEDTLMLRGMYKSARDYITGFSWCPPVKASFFGAGVGGVVAIFLFEFDKPISGGDDQLWVVAGDVPSAYLVTDDATDPVSAMRVYCELMTSWIEAVRSGQSLDGVFPVSAEPTPDNAEMLERRVAFIRREFIPEAAGLK